MRVCCAVAFLMGCDSPRGLLSFAGRAADDLALLWTLCQTALAPLLLVAQLAVGTCNEELQASATLVKKGRC